MSSCQIFTALTKHVIPPNMLLVSLSFLPDDIWHIMHLSLSMPDDETTLIHWLPQYPIPITSVEHTCPDCQ